MPLAGEKLELADQHIADGLERIRLQQDRIRRLKQFGHDTTSFDEMLRLFEATLELMIRHRELIARELELTAHHSK
jgi:truncated hemoglobin YjbI